MQSGTPNCNTVLNNVQYYITKINYICHELVIKKNKGIHIRAFCKKKNLKYSFYNFPKFIKNRFSGLENTQCGRIDFFDNTSVDFT